MELTDVIHVDNLWRRYGHATSGFDAVRGVSLTVRRGELFALLGTNGAGKTSTLEVLEGLARPSAGTVRVLGRDPFRDRRLVRPRIGAMLQEGGFPTGLTVRETAEMWAGTLSSPRPVAEALELVDLAHRAGVAVRQLSGGEGRRLDLALAVLGRPELLFLDEPTAGLDPESRSRTWRLVRNMLDAGTTVFLTTHYLAEAEDLADRLAVMHRGRIVESGTPAQVAAAQPARISFTRPADGWLPAARDLPGVVAVEVDRPSGSRVVVTTRDLERSLRALLAQAATRGTTLVELDARSPSLEEAFLALARDHTSDDLTEEIPA